MDNESRRIAALPTHEQWIAAVEKARECAGGCGLAPEPGDIFCQGCREGHERDRLWSRDDDDSHMADDDWNTGRGNGENTR